MEKQYRAIEGEIRFLESRNPWFFDVEIWFLNDKTNNNNWKYTDLERNMRTLPGTPILIAYIGKQIGDGHNFRMVRDPKTGEEAATFTDATAERIVGAVSERIEDFRLEERDGNTWIVGKGKLWRWYARELVEKIKTDAKQGHQMSISVETLVSKSRMDGDVEIEIDYEFLGTTILGDHVRPAVDNARITVLNEIKGQFNELKIRAASYNEQKAEENTEGVKTTVKHYNKNQISVLAEKFTGYTVLDATQDEGKIHVCMADKEGCILTYDMDSVDDAATVNAANFGRMNTEIEGENGITLRLSDVTEALVGAKEAENKVLREQNAALEKRATDAEAAVNRMNEQETKRRKAAAKAAALRELASINENRAEDEQIAESAIQRVLEAADRGDYCDECGEDGEWTGDAAAEADVRECAMQKQKEIDKAKKAAARNASKRTYAFEPSFNGGSETDNPIEAVYNEICK